MRKFLTFLGMVCIILATFVIAADFTPQGNINLRWLYNITGAPYVNATTYYGDGQYLTGISGSGDINGVTTNGPYLTGGVDAGVAALLVNETYLNATISDLAGSGDNSSWNESYANTLYSNDTWVDTYFVRFTELVDQIGNWSSDKASYYTSTIIDSLGNWSADKSSYATGDKVDSLGNWSDDKSDYSTTTTILGFSYYNSTDFSISNYYTSSQIDGFSYYNSTDFSIADYSTTTDMDTAIEAANTTMKTYVDAQDSDTTYTNGSAINLTGTEFSLTTCGDNEVWKMAGSSWNCEADATGSGTEGAFTNITNFTGTLTDGKICIYDSSQQIINCTYTDQTGASGNVKIGDGFYTYNDSTTIYFNATLAGINLSVNSSDYWDNLGSPSDINAGDITDDGTFSNNTWVDSLFVRFTEIVAQVGNWTLDKTSYYSSSDIDGFSYYNATDFSITDYLTSTVILGFSYYNSTDFSISDYSTTASLVGLLGNWSKDKSDYWNSSTDLDDAIATDEITELKIDFNTVCAAGSHLYISGNNLACETDDDTTYTAGNKLYLSGTELNVNDTELNESIEAYGYSMSSGTVTSVATDDTYLTGGAITTTGTVTFNTTLAGTSLAVNSSDYWDNLGSPSDIGTDDITDDGTWRLQSWDNITGIPHATPTDSDVTHFSLSDEIYDWVVGLAYTPIADLVAQVGNWSADKSSYTITSGLVAILGNWSADKGDYSTTTEAGNLYATIDEPLWTANFTAYNTSWSTDDDTTYTAGDNLDLTGTVFSLDADVNITTLNVSTHFVIDTVNITCFNGVACTWYSNATDSCLYWPSGGKDCGAA